MSYDSFQRACIYCGADVVLLKDKNNWVIPTNPKSIDKKDNSNIAFDIDKHMPHSLECASERYAAIL